MLKPQKFFHKSVYRTLCFLRESNNPSWHKTFARARAREKKKNYVIQFFRNKEKECNLARREQLKAASQGKYNFRHEKGRVKKGGGRVAGDLN